MNWGIVILIISTILGIYIGFLIQRPVATLCDPSNCPYCYGDNLCKDVEEKKINLEYKSFSDLFYNLFSVKNVYFADYKGVRVVLKKLAHQNDELNQITFINSIENSILNYLNQPSSNTVANLKMCTKKASEMFLNDLRKIFSLGQIWTACNVNPEPLILALFQNKDYWPIPELYGACGFMIVEEYCGKPLDYYQSSDWYLRAFLAVQLLEAAVNFTEKHENFRMYLTDISPDNIAVDDNFKLYFIDLENVILKQKHHSDIERVHYSEYFDEDDFVYDQDAICESSLSDHNIYAVCKLLLSRKAPWPMMQNGLLHSPPSNVVFRYNELFALIEECVDSKEKFSRFYIAEELIKLLNEVIR